MNLGFAACPGNLWIMKKFQGQVGLKGALAKNRMSSTSFKPGLLTSKYKGNKSKLRPPQFGLKRSYVREKNWSVTQIKELVWSVLDEYVCIFHVRAHSQARPFFGSVMHVGVLSIQFNKKSIDRLVCLDEGFRVLRNIRGSPPHSEKCKRDLTTPTPPQKNVYKRACPYYERKEADSWNMKYETDIAVADNKVQRTNRDDEQPVR
ncbi:hypothetical protein pdam_00024761 [Pocillopora damicornis]|uniref:Uncharacterized protein n=1 Tax=Pocillopora damicornis TaxID=46731 RepID=A0A3M6UP99_POCDA|nr:hypothetical protein pdam_00024761 [Pocillopora damicornis]